jgi:hypothetical protein
MFLGLGAGYYWMLGVSAPYFFSFCCGKGSCHGRFYMKMLVNQEFIFYLCCGQTRVKYQVCPWQLFQPVFFHFGE